MTAKGRLVLAALVWTGTLLLLGLGRGPAGAASPDAQISPQDQVAATEAIALFNKIYQDFYATGGDPALIDAMPASKDVKHRIYRDLGFLRDAGLVMVIDLASSAPRGEPIAQKDGAAVVIHEAWNYVYQKAADRTPVSAIKGMEGDFRYVLEKERRRWIIASWDPLSEPSPAKGGGPQ